MIKIFSYIPELDCFVVTPAYQQVADYLGLTEWHEAVWIGRFFMLDNDYGEHWFDNWELREALTEQAQNLGLNTHNLLIIDPNRFQNGLEISSHSATERKQFWTDVLKSLQLSYDTLFAEARKLNDERKETNEEDYIPDLEIRIDKIRSQIQNRQQAQRDID